MFQPLDGPSKSYKLSAVGTGTPVVVKDGANPVFEDRKVITMQGNGKFYVYLADEGETPNAAKIIDVGLLQFKDTKENYEAGPKQAVFVLAFAGTVDIRISARG